MKTLARLKMQNSLLAIMLMLLLFLALNFIPETISRLTKVLAVKDSAAAAQFDVIVTPPEEFRIGSDEPNFEYRFVSAAERKELTFTVANNGETDVICTPHLMGNFDYWIYVKGEDLFEFEVLAGETIEFEVHIKLVRLNTEAQDVQFNVDIRQMEGDQGV